MIKTFTPNILIYDWTEDSRNEMTDEVVSTEDCLSPSEETISFLKRFARSITIEADANLSFPTA
ncbi:MAG: hypothetical protein J6T67_02435 [Paludibacteraceae bacterium]|nr:hypothetical protein [Paludibacteraceae bacterium]MBR4713171.1 hypothetical protein [Paludibacteraceae bacterium]